ncbi:MAG: hypothetical protein F4X25_10390 [Chloroflexi bacterium]|nr:hypothetical protein [Chloroflexota bacterium]
MSGRNLTLALGAIVLGFVTLALAACSEAGPQRAEAQLPELQVTISPADCGEVAVAAADSADTAFVYTSDSPSTWAHASDTHLELRARAKAGCAFARWVVAWGGAEFPTYGTTARAQFISGMTATAYFTGTPATPTATATATATSTPSANACTQTTLGVDPATNSALAADCAALLAAKAALADAGTLDWSADTAMTDWDGVTLGGTPQRVTGLSLMLQGVAGSIPKELGGLTALRTLNLSWNKLLGAIPAELGSLTELRSLDLSRNRLTGGIPSALGGLTKLEHLTLSQNFLDGSIPAGLGGLANLEGLYLYQNRLTESIPPELENLSSLTALFLGENELSGCVPRALRALARNDLATLELRSCPLPATTLSYDSYDTTGAVATAGSYAFLTEADDGTMSAVTTYEGLRDGTTSALLIHKSDAGGTSRATVYDMVEAGDLFEWKEADDCFVRYTVTEVKPDPAGTVPRKSLAVESIAYAFTGCSGAITTSASASVTWGALPNLGGTSLTAPIVQGPFQLVPAGWTGATKAVGPRRPGGPAVPYAYTTSLAEARTFPHWREPDLPEGWAFTDAVSGDEADVGYFRAFYDGLRLVVSAYDIAAKYGPKEATATYAGSQTSVRETLQIAGRPARVRYSITDRQYRVTVHVWDEATGVLYMLRGSPDMATLIAFAESMFE